MDTKKYFILAAVLVMAFMVGRWGADESPAKAKAKTGKARTGKVEQTNVTVQQLQEVLNKGRKLTSLQRQEALKNYINKQVQWKGKLKLADCSDGQLCAVISHKVKPSWLLGQRKVQVTVNFPDSQKETLLNAQKGSWVTYQGILSEYTGSAKSPWLLTDGQILRIEVDQPKVRISLPATKGI